MSVIEQRTKRYERFMNRRAKNPPKYGDEDNFPLPNEIYFEIFLFLETQDVFLGVAIACKKFREIAESEELYIELFLRRVKFGKDYTLSLLSKEDLTSPSARDYLIRNGGKIKSCFRRIWRFRKARLQDFKDFNTNKLLDIEEQNLISFEGEVLKKRLNDFFTLDRAVEGCWEQGKALRMRTYWDKEKKILTLSKFIMEEFSWGQCPYCMESRWFIYLDMPSENSLILRFYYDMSGKNEYKLYFEKCDDWNYVLKRFDIDKTGTFSYLIEDYDLYDGESVKKDDYQLAGICFVFSWCVGMIENKNIFNLGDYCADERYKGKTQEIQVLKKFDRR